MVDGVHAGSLYLPDDHCTIIKDFIIVLNLYNKNITPWT